MYNSSTGLPLKFHFAVHCALQYKLYCRRTDLYGYKVGGSFDTFFLFGLSLTDHSGSSSQCCSCSRVKVINSNSTHKWKLHVCVTVDSTWMNTVIMQSDSWWVLRKKLTLHVVLLIRKSQYLLVDSWLIVGCLLAQLADNSQYGFKQNCRLVIHWQAAQPSTLSIAWFP